MTDVVNHPETRPNRLNATGSAEDAPDSPRTRSLAAPQRPAHLSVAIALIIGFWALQFVYFTLDNLLRQDEVEGWRDVAARAIMMAIGAVISFGILKFLRRGAGASLLKRALIALGLAYAGATIHSLINSFVFYAIKGPTAGAESSLPPLTGGFPLLVYLFSWVYLAITVLLLSLTYGEELLRREVRIAELSSDVDRARLDGLRYQLNPHFLFNSLNSAASLVAARRSAEAELMLENLADFLRATLKLDADSEISLRDELGLQSLYLEVEEIRFPHRLRVEKEVPEELLDALVPNLITQALIENCIKHSVARSTEPVCLTIGARETGGQLEIRVSDSGGNATSAASGGAGVGLRNVAKRLELHFGSAAGFHAGRTGGGGFEAVMSIPLRKTR